MDKIIEEQEFRNKKFVFRDRYHAGKLLAEKLKDFVISFQDPVVLAIPSGGVPVGFTIAKELKIPLDLVVVRKIPIPYDPEAGFGSISRDGEVLINTDLVNRLNLTEDEIRAAISTVKYQLDERMKKFRGKRPFPELKERTVVIVDDGLASGYTMLSSIRSIKKYSPAEIIVAVPTASGNAVYLVTPEIDRLFCLNIRTSMVFAVADAYQEWHDLTEQEVLAILKKYHETT